jgi:nucleotide-binding universal stress UspA family protein
MGMGRILTLVHEPGSCDRSLDYAVSLAQAQHAELQVLHVLPPIPPIPADPCYNLLGRKRYRELLHAQAEAGFAMVRALCIPDVAIKDLLILDGDLVEAVAGVAAHFKPDLIILPESVLRVWSSLFRRRVLEKLARGASAPVLLFPREPAVREFTCLHCPPAAEVSAAPEAA